MKRIKATIAALASLVAGGAWAADYTVERKLDMSATSTEVWRVIGDFCDIDDWHPGFNGCDLKVIDGRLHRVLSTPDGVDFVERRIAAERGLSYTYKIVSSPLPVEKFTATLSVTPTNGTQVVWYARFQSDDPSTEAAVGEMFDTGLAAIAAKLGAD